MAFEFHTTRRVEWADTDTAGIIHFSRYFCFMEQAEHEFLRSLGLSCLMERDGKKFTWPRVSAQCEFIRPVRFEDVLDVDLTVKRKGQKSLTFEFKFKHNGTEVAHGQVSAVCCEIIDHRLEAVPIPDFVSGMIEESPIGTAKGSSSGSPQ
jgi:YbgC/YbaW family acyl-CoA thioester hydrolase